MLVKIEMGTKMDLAKRNLIDIQQYIEFLEENNHLIRLKSEVDSYLELAGIAKKNGFSGYSLKGNSYPLQVN